MLFNSVVYIFAFLPITFFIYFYLNKKRLIKASKIFLVFSSLFFYSWWNIKYLPLILISMLFNYTIGRELSNKYKNRFISSKKLLSIGIIFNLSLLGYFKYMDFFIKNINNIFNSNISMLHLALPLAISFFTFQQIAYLVDSYKNETKEYDFLNYALFVTFFPQLIAGPIVHHSEMMPQFANIKNKVRNYNNIALGLFIFSIGLFKKVVIADTFSQWATYGFDVAKNLNMLEAWCTSLSYTFQIYFDFSGYTDMAIGTAFLFNIKLPINFYSPYKAINIQDFWRRWHITLSRFLKDYIYIPLGGNRKGKIRTYLNIFITFLLGGIWHGAGWTFIIWGILHGIGLIIYHIWKQIGITIPKIIAWFITFNFLNITWIFFRAENFTDVKKIIKGMFKINEYTLSIKWNSLFDSTYKIGQFFGFYSSKKEHFITIFSIELIIFAFIIVLFTNNSIELSKKFAKMKKIPILWLIYSSFLLGVSFLIISIQKGSEFLYFNF